MKPATARSLILALALAALPATADDWSLEWWTIDGGGEVFSTGGQWELSGTLGQWDATALNVQTGGSWSLAGGFWPVTVAETDLIFRDAFEL